MGLTFDKSDIAIKNIKETVAEGRPVGQCPICGSSNLDMGYPEVDDTLIFYTVTCQEEGCNTMWDENFYFRNIDQLWVDGEHIDKAWSVPR